MADDPTVRLSRFLSFVLRHDPGSIGVVPDASGWVEVEALLAAAAAHGHPITPASLAEVVATNDKRRFAFSPDGTRIRASQGHSFPVDLGLAPRTPPAVLHHGTASRFVAAIQREGLRPRGRRQVHLSADAVTARAVGARHGVPVVLRVDAAAMARDGHVFTQADNGVWLVDAVPARYLSRDEPGR